MVLLADVGGTMGVVKTLNAVSVPPDVIEEIVKILQQESTSLEGGSFNEVPATWFGGRFSGQNLGNHTKLAHQHLSNSVLEAVASLQSTGEAIEQFDKELESADADAHAATTALLSRTQQAVDQLDDNRHTPPALPTEGSKP
jgi:hypothetical protein